MAYMRPSGTPVCSRATRGCTAPALLIAFFLQTHNWLLAAVLAGHMLDAAHNGADGLPNKAVTKHPPPQAFTEHRAPQGQVGMPRLGIAYGIAPCDEVQVEPLHFQGCPLPYKKPMEGTLVLGKLIDPAHNLAAKWSVVQHPMADYRGAHQAYAELRLAADIAVTQYITCPTDVSIMYFAYGRTQYALARGLWPRSRPLQQAYLLISQALASTCRADAAVALLTSLPSANSFTSACSPPAAQTSVCMTHTISRPGTGLCLHLMRFQATGYVCIN